LRNFKTSVIVTVADHGQVKMFRDHDLFRRSWNRAWSALQNATKAAREAKTDEESKAQRAIAENMTDQLNSAEDDLRMIRRLMRENSLVPPPLPDELGQVDDSHWSRAVSASAVHPIQVRPVANILGMGRPVLLDLSEMKPAWRTEVMELLSVLMDELHGTAQRLPDAGIIQLTPGRAEWDDVRASLARFTAALEASAAALVDGD
jgi:hypothetical protein